ncbi:MAG: PD40 domain-containing protein [Prevotella sp.]|nr:PD40 domain-containing protein [Candidatus Prevotella equi]
MKIQHYISVLLAVIAFISCGHPAVPDNAQQSNALPTIFPDYTEVTIPSNICPLNFMLRDGSDAVVARLTVDDKSYTYGDDNKVIIDEDEWAELRNAAKGNSITVEVFGQKDGHWTAYKPFRIYVAEEEIDPYLSYRLIQPSYVAYEGLSISQRDITTYEETDIYNNQMIQTEDAGQCINCHSYQNYGTKGMLFHMRQKQGGTMLVHDGTVEKIDLKTDSTISAGVYPSWHPTENLIAFSTNKTNQVFHTKHNGKIEVFDKASDLILYDVKNHSVKHITNKPDDLETFPTWAPDGKTLYYCTAHLTFPDDTLSRDMHVIMQAKEIRYNIYSRSFDAKTRTFGPEQLVFDAAAIKKSATLPRLSPDGRYIVFSIGDYGCFHVWHNEADIMILDLQKPDATPVPLAAINSKYSESYPSFSSNGRWIMADSRLFDGNYTRPVISYFDKTGKAHKAFVLPQKDPEFYTLFLRSYNRPEFMKEPVTITPQTFLEKAKQDAKRVKNEE